MVEEYIKLYVERSDNWIAEDLGVHNETVTAKREELEEKGEVTETVTLKGKDGKEYPRKQAKPKTPEPVPGPVQAGDNTPYRLPRIKARGLARA